MGCDVCMTGDFDGYVDMPQLSTPKARKQHRCEECGKAMDLGKPYERYSGKFEGEFFVVRTCLLCAEIRQAFYCNGAFTTGLLWDDMHEYVFPKLTTASDCFTKLSAAAKARVLEEWRKWKGLES